MPESPSIKIRNWSKWQTYRGDRGQPPWIKVHRSLMRDPDWVALPDALRGQLVAIWLLAADRSGVIPASPRLIKKLCFMDTEPDLNALAERGFLLGVTPAPKKHQSGATVTAQSRVEESRGEEIREEANMSPGRRQDDDQAERQTQLLDVSDLMASEEEARGEAVTPATDDDRAMADSCYEFLQQQVEKVDPRLWKGNPIHGGDQFILLHGQGFGWDEIQKAISFSRKHPFWSTVVFSPTDFTRNFNKITGAMNGKTGVAERRAAERKAWVEDDDE